MREEWTVEIPKHRRLRWCLWLLSGILCGAASFAAATDWQLQPIVASGGSLPDGGRLLQVGEVFALGADDVAFWARYTSDVWALYRWTDGELHRLLVDDIDFSLPGLSAPVKIKYARGGLTLPSAWNYSDGKVYFEGRRSGTKADLLLLDHKGLRKLLAEGDPIPGSTARITNVHLLTAGQGKALFFVRSGKPDKRSRLALWNGDDWQVLATEKEELPGLTGTRVRDVDYFTTGAIAPDGVLAALRTEDGTKLFQLSSTRSIPLFALGDSLRESNQEAAPASLLDWFGDVEAWTTNDFVITIGVGRKSVPEKTYLFSWKNGSLRRISPWLGEEEEDPHVAAFEMRTFDSSPIRAVAVALLQGRTKSSWDQEHTPLEPAFVVFDGTSWRQLTTPTNLCCAYDDPYEYETNRRLINLRIRRAGAGNPGVIVALSPGAMSAPPEESGVRRVKGTGFGVYGVRPEHPVHSLYLSPDDPTNLVDPPRIDTDRGPVSLGEVVTWLSGDRGVVLHDGGLWMLAPSSAAEVQQDGTDD